MQLFWLRRRSFVQQSIYANMGYAPILRIYKTVLPIGTEFPADCTTPVNDISFSEHFLIYPTIFDNYINLEFLLNESVNLKVRFFDVLGREVHKKEYQNLPSGINQLEVNTDGFLSNGIYFLQFEMGNKITTRKVFRISH